MSKPRYTKREVDILRQHFSTLPMLLLHELMPNRSIDAIREKGKRMGISRIRSMDKNIAQRKRPHQPATGMKHTDEWKQRMRVIGYSKVHTRTIDEIATLSNVSVEYAKAVLNVS